jgi:DNA-binding MarR family transcriptional regulator
VATPETRDDAAIERLLGTLPRQNTQLVRLLYRQSGTLIPRGMAGLLAAVAEKPQRITDLAAREGLAQPTVTRMIARLESQGLVRRRRDQDDRRAVVVTVTPHGGRELAKLRLRYAEILRASLAELEESEIEALVAGASALEALIGVLQRRAGPTV